MQSDKSSSSNGNSSRQRTFDALSGDFDFSSYSDENLDILRKIMNRAELLAQKRSDMMLLTGADADDDVVVVDSDQDAAVVSHASGTRQDREGQRKAVVVTFASVMRSYESVLAEHGVDAAEDIHYYRFLLKLSLLKMPELSWSQKLEAECERCRREQITKTFGNKKRIAEAWLRWRAYVDEVYADGRARGCTTRHVGPQKNVGPGRSREDTHARVVTSLRSCLRTWRANVHAVCARDKENFHEAECIWTKNAKSRMLRRWRQRSRSLKDAMIFRAVELWKANMLSSAVRWWRSRCAIAARQASEAKARAALMRCSSS